MRKDKLVNYSFKIAKDTFEILDKKIKNDKEITKEELKIWEDTGIVPDKYNKEFIAFLEDFVKNNGK